MNAKMGAGRFSLPPIIPPSRPLPPVTKTTPDVQWVTVTPEQAQHWLGECNIGNRPIREEHVLRLATDMEQGNWRGLNGEPIKFDTNGRMFEGQHRCWACVLAKVPFETLMLTGCDPDDFNTSGTGKMKTYADFIRHEKNAHLLAAVTKLVYFWSRGELDGVSQKAAPTNTQMDEVLRDHPLLRDSVNRVANVKAFRSLLTSAYAGLLHYAATLEGKNASIESFLERLGTGLGLFDTDPVYHLRRFLLSQRGAQPNTRRPGRTYVLALAIKCWNATKEDRQMKMLQFRMDEKFPQL